MDSYAFEGQFTDFTVVGLTALGLRLDLEFTGEITAGPLAGATISGTDFLLIRHDGVGQVNVREHVTQGDRVVASIRFLGYAVPPIVLPELSALITPDFEWPDIDLPMHGAAFFEAASEELSAATAIVYGVSGAVNLATGTVHIAAESLAPTHKPVAAS